MAPYINSYPNQGECMAAGDDLLETRIVVTTFSANKLVASWQMFSLNMTFLVPKTSFVEFMCLLHSFFCHV